MKTLGSAMATLLPKNQLRPESHALLRYLGLLAAVIAVFSTLFHFIMQWEGQSHSWLTALYWTLTVMSTLGFGDITFHSDLGRGFTIVVLLTGLVLLLIVLPFVFIRSVYAPWLEARLRSEAPRVLPADIRDHVILCRYDEVVRVLIEGLKLRRIEHVVIEPDPGQAALLHRSGVRVVCDTLEARRTFEAAGFTRARLLVANAEDATNANITITARELSANVPIVATVIDADATDVLQLAGADHVLALRHHLGEHLASRVSVGRIRSHTVGRYKGLVIAEFPIRHTSVAGRTLAETGIRSRTGVTVPVIAKRGHLEPGLPDTVLREDCIGVAVGREQQVAALDDLLSLGEEPGGDVLVIGGGKVGRNAARALKRRGVPVQILEEKADLRELLEKIADRVIIGDAADLTVMQAASIERVSSVILTTNDDTTNIFLAIYCRSLNPRTIIVSRVRHLRNIEAIHRAGADFALSDPQLGVQSILSLLERRELVLLGEGLELFHAPVPRSLVGLTLRAAGVRGRTGLSILGIDYADRLDGAPTPETVLEPGAELLFIGSSEQLEAFEREFA
jgi:Trk K+ transport system NAD-binding subunit